jgi:phosphohistidine phosphatase SixA
MRALVTILVLLAAGCGGATAPETDERLDPVQLVEALQEGGLVVYLRHTATDRSKEDDTVVDFENCSTQRNLSGRGREQARMIGRAFRELEIPVDEVVSSEYCRTRETAELAFGRPELEPDLTGFPNRGEPTYDERVRRTRELLGEDAGDGNLVLVAHVKNLEAAAQVSIDEGELAVFQPLGGEDFRHLGDIAASSWPQLVEKLGPDA